MSEPCARQKFTPTKKVARSYSGPRCIRRWAAARALARGVGAAGGARARMGGFGAGRRRRRARALPRARPCAGRACCARVRARARTETARVRRLGARRVRANTLGGGRALSRALAHVCGLRVRHRAVARARAHADGARSGAGGARMAGNAQAGGWRAGPADQCKNRLRPPSDAGPGRRFSSSLPRVALPPHFLFLPLPPPAPLTLAGGLRSDGAPRHVVDPTSVVCAQAMAATPPEAEAHLRHVRGGRRRGDHRCKT